MTRRTTGRLLLGAGSVAALAISPAFALSYFWAHGFGSGEVPPGWMADLAPRLIEWGWLGGSDQEGLYATYGMWYFGFLVITLVGMILLLQVDLGERWTAGGWGVVLVGLGLAAVGTFGDYSGIGPLSGLFLLELVGALVVAVGTMMIGVRLWRSDRRGLSTVGLVGPISLVVGFMMFGHFPSGPLSIILLGSFVLAYSGMRWTPDA